MASSSAKTSCRHFSLDEIEDARNHFGNSKFLGRGGEGMVYLTKVHIEGEDTWVAVKRLFTISSLVLEKEIQTVPKIQHPHIVSLLGYCEESGEKILVYEYVENGSLSDYVRGRGKILGLPNELVQVGRFRLVQPATTRQTIRDKQILTWKQRLNICLGAARGLQHLHTPTDEFPFGIIHRDVKPGNILVDSNWVGKVSDFGMFKLSHAGQKKSSMSTDLRGTTGYYAPEYVESHRVTRKIDVYAFGVVLFEVLCGKMPWDRGGLSYYRRDDEDLGLWAQENVDIEIKGEISPDSLRAFADIINKSLRRKPDLRPIMNDVVLDLEKVLKFQELHDEAKELRDHSAGVLPTGTRRSIGEKEERGGEIMAPEKKNTEEVHTHTHKLVLHNSKKEFMCYSCHDLGTGERYCCPPCDFNIHENCATWPGFLLLFLHPHLLNLVMISKVEATLPICDVCDGPIEGLFYRCNDFDFDVHPICTQYPQNLWHMIHLMHPLTLQTSTRSRCMVCAEECTNSLQYSCAVCSFSTHLECISKGSASPSTPGTRLSAPTRGSQPPIPSFEGLPAGGLPLVLLHGGGGDPDAILSSRTSI